jgi:hypothetical protein
MLNQQATLASLFDTDSPTVGMQRAPAIARDSEDASPTQPVSAAQPDSASKRHVRHAHHHAFSSAR